MPTFIPARGRTLHVAGICINRIGNEPRSSEGARLVAHLGPINLVANPNGLQATPFGVT